MSKPVTYVIKMHGEIKENKPWKIPENIDIYYRNIIGAKTFKRSYSNILEQNCQDFKYYLKRDQFYIKEKSFPVDIELSTEANVTGIFCCETRERGGGALFRQNSPILQKNRVKRKRDTLKEVIYSYIYPHTQEFFKGRKCRVFLIMCMQDKSLPRERTERLNRIQYNREKDKQTGRKLQGQWMVDEELKILEPQ